MASFSHYRVNTDHMVPIISGSEENKGNFIDTLVKKLKINILSLNEQDIDFDLIGVDASVANALRRILLAEVFAIRSDDWTEYVHKFISVCRYPPLQLSMFGLLSTAPLFKTKY